MFIAGCNVRTDFFKLCVRTAFFHQRHSCSVCICYVECFVGESKKELCTFDVVIIDTLIAIYSIFFIQKYSKDKINWMNLISNVSIKQSRKFSVGTTIGEAAIGAGHSNSNHIHHKINSFIQLKKNFLLFSLSNKQFYQRLFLTLFALGVWLSWHGTLKNICTSTVLIWVPHTELTPRIG